MLWFIVISILLAIIHAEPLPPLLTSKTFKSSIQSQNLSLIEFYSPYCSHCNAFAPTWEKTFNEFINDSITYNIKMFQVNCIESGDLCNQEKIMAYPSIKLYGPNGFITNFPNSLKRTKENIIEFMKEQSLDMAGGSGIKVDSKSSLITTEQMIKLLGESNKDPYLISFWPSEDLKDLNQLDWTKFSKSDYYEDCIEFQTHWSIISNSLNSVNIKTGHFNCLKNKKICKELGINEKGKPEVKFFLPKINTAKVINYPYPEDLNIKKIINFAKHTLQISKFEKIDSIQLLDHGKLKTKLKPLEALPTNAQNTFIYVYDEKLTVKEDFQILPYLINEFAKYDNTEFYLSNDTNILKILEFQQKNLASSIKNGKFNEDKFIINTMTSLPTILSFKEYSLLNSVYQSFGPMDIRDERKVKNFINENSTPFIQELTPKNYKSKISPNSKSSSSAILLIDSKSPNLPDLDTFILGAHEFEEIKSNYSYTQLVKSREYKYAKAEQQKHNNEFKKMIKTLRQEIHQPKLTETQFFYIDVSHSKLLHKLGLSVNGEIYTSGDLIILNNGYYYTPNELISFGQILASIRGFITGSSIKGTLINSPYGAKLRIFDLVHQYGFWGYMGLIMFITIGVKMIKLIKGKKNKETYLPLFDEKKDRKD